MAKQYTPNDKWSQKAKQDGYRARSVYKLQEIQERLHVLKSRDSVLDLGACPGSWLQYVRTIVQGTVVGIDLTPIDPIDGVELFQADITDSAALNKIFIQLNIKKFPVIISDLAPKTSGITDIDQWRSIELSQAVLQVARSWLSFNGTVIMKILRGADFDEFYTDLKRDFAMTKVFIAKASRDSSREVYVIASQPFAYFFTAQTEYDTEN